MSEQAPAATRVHAGPGFKETSADAGNSDLSVRATTSPDTQGDMTEQFRRVSAAMRAAEERLDAVLHCIRDAAIVVDADARVTNLNPLAERLTGWPAPDAAGRRIEEVFAIPEAEASRLSGLSVKRTLIEGTTQSPAEHVIMIMRNGARCTVACSCAPIRCKTGEVAGAVVIFRDVTAEQLSQQAMRDHATQIQAILNTVPDGVITFHADDGLIETVNPAAEQIFGYTADELVGQNCTMLIPGARNGAGEGFQEYSAASDAAYSSRLGREAVGLRKDGRTFPMEVVMSEMWLHGQRHYTGVFRDITERHRLDQILYDNYAELKKATAIAEKANLAKSEFLSRMSHELRTPLNAILGFAQLLESGSPQPTVAQADRLRQITKAGWYLLDLINEILDLAVIESGKLQLSPETVALTEVLRECQAMVESQAQKRAIQLNFLPFDATLSVNADRTRIKQILINLLSNAIKYNSHNGTVEVECGPSAPDRIRITVKDTGAGLSPKKLSQLFQPFNRLGQENGNEEGTGMGLVVAKQLVELMGGAIGVKSAVGRGSEFWIELIRDTTPQHPASDAAAAQLPARGGAAAQRTLLYVEDNPANLMLIEQIIEGQPHLRMLSADRGRAGVSLARAHLPDVVLMDINLPDISGIEAMDMLHADPSTKHIPVLAVSANAMQRDVEKGLERGFFRYLTKPIKVDEFLEALDDALDFSRAGSFNDVRTGRAK